MAKMGYEIPSPLPQCLIDFMLNYNKQPPQQQHQQQQQQQQQQYQQMQSQPQLQVQQQPQPLINPKEKFTNIKQPKQKQQIMQQQFKQSPLISPILQQSGQYTTSQVSEKDKEIKEIKSKNLEFMKELCMKFSKGLNQISEENQYLTKEVGSIQQKKLAIIQQIFSIKSELQVEILRTKQLQNAYLQEMENFNKEIIQISLNPDNILIAAQKISQKEIQKVNDMTMFKEKELTESTNAMMKRKKSLLIISQEVHSQKQKSEKKARKKKSSGRYEFLDSESAKEVIIQDLDKEVVSKMFKRKQKDKDKKKEVEETKKTEEKDDGEQVVNQQEFKSDFDEFGFTGKFKNEFTNPVNNFTSANEKKPSAFNDSVGGEWVDFSQDI